MQDKKNNEQEHQTLLVVSEKEEDIEFIRSHLEPQGFELLFVDDCDCAYEDVVHGGIDLLMIDIEGTREESCALCTMMHKKKETASIPIIAITRPQDSDDKGQVTLDIGADDFLGRPLQMPALLVRVKMLLRLKELHEGLSKRNEELEKVNQELASRNRELVQGLEMAHRLQKTLLPQKYPKVKNTSFYHIYMPADAIGGDIFQLEPLPDNKAVVFLSDVSGHGIRAALVTSILKTVFEHVYFEDKTAGQILSDVNSRFRNIMGSLSPHIYATAFLMIIDGENRTASVASAGHVRPFLVSKHNMSCEPVMPIETVGPALGFFQNATFEKEDRQLDKGDIILGFTDGLYEVTNYDEELFGLERLQELIQKNIHLIPRDLIEKILRETDAYRRNRKRPDDVCVVAAEIH